jgi:hypothetical protein
MISKHSLIIKASALPVKAFLGGLVIDTRRLQAVAPETGLESPQKTWVLLPMAWDCCSSGCALPERIVPWLGARGDRVWRSFLRLSPRPRYGRESTM